MTHTVINMESLPLPYSVQTEQPRGSGQPNPQYRSISQPDNPFSLHYLESQYPRQIALPLSFSAASPRYVVQFVNLGPQPYNMICPACGVVTRTTIKREPLNMSDFSKKSCACLWWPCYWIPYCSNRCLTVKHYCSNCGIFLGQY